MMLRTTLACAMLALAQAAAAATPAASADEQWRAFMANARYERTNEAYRTLGSVQYAAGTVDAEGCRESKASLAAAVRDVPVGLALRHAALLCAEALGDRSDAHVHTEALASLTRHAAVTAGPGAWKLPLRVVRPEDVDAFLQIAGLERRYAYYGSLWPEGGLPLYVAAYDAVAKRESHIAFDWVDTLARLSSEDRLQGYFIDRHLIANAFLEAWAEDDDIASVDILALRQAVIEDRSETKRDRLKAAAGRGGLLAAQTWLELCSQQPFAGCADGFIDAVLPFAERGHALSRTQLGVAYLRGMGVKADEVAGRSLIEAANGSWEDAGGIIHVASALSLAKTPHPAWLQARLAEAEAAGVGAARALRVAREATEKSGALSPADRDWLALPANNRSGRGYALLAAAAEMAKSNDAPDLRERAATAGDAVSMRMRALDVLESEPDAAAALTRLRGAALQGEGIAARALAYHALQKNRPAEARDWLLGKVTEGDVDAYLMLARLYEQDFEALGKGPKDAAELYGHLVTEVPEARRRLAMLLVEGRGVGKDAARARQLLEQDPEDTESLGMLGALLIRERIPGDVARGRALLDAAVLANDRNSMSDYGLWLANHEPTPEGRKRGLELLTGSQADDATRTSLNNLAWLRCVSRHADVRDPAAGMELSLQLGKPEALDPGAIDTVAACQAAAGGYAEAARLQSLAIEKLPQGKTYAETRRGMQSRLALYRKGGHYIEPAVEQD